ncbi:PhnD/SsuA/transferrin family substrate-binding protein, partial [bacterium]|nr:PhnD/SsuA/transferrin family substrate-binding protein [bacterium]
IILIALLVLCSSFLYSADHDVKVKEYVLGVPVYSGKLLDTQGFNHLIQNLNKRFGKEIRLKAVFFNSYKAIENSFFKNEIDFAVFPPFIYASNMARSNVRYLGTKLVNGRDYTYNSVCVVRKDSHARKIGDLKNKKIGFSSKSSSSGYLIPQLTLKEKGMYRNGKPLFKPVFCGSHQNVMIKIITGEIDAGFTFTDSYLDYKNNLKPIAVSRLKIPYDVLVANKNTVSQDFFRKFEKILHTIKIPYQRGHWSVYRKIHSGIYRKFFMELRKSLKEIK